MELQTIFLDPKAQILANPAQKYIELEWFAHPGSTAFRDVISRAQDYAQQHHLTRWLCNLEEAEFLEEEDQKWLVQEVFAAFNPQLYHSYAYLIRPVVPEVVTTYRINDLVQQDEQLNARITVSIFLDVDLAKRWLFANHSQTVNSVK